MKKIFYGFGGLSYSVISQTISNFFMFFATSVLGLKGTLVGIIVGISTIWDGFSDTIVGYCSDNCPLGKLGKRRGYMLMASLGMSIFNIGLWCVPNSLNTTAKFLWIFVSLLLLETFNTMFATPYSALANDLAKNNSDRTKYNSFNIVFYLVGIIIPSILMIFFLPNTEEFPIGQLNPKGYQKIAIVTSTICLFFGCLCSLGVRDNNIVKLPFRRDKFTIKGLFANSLLSFKNSKLRKIIWGYICASVVTVFLSSVGLHFFTYSFFYPSFRITILLLTLIVANIISQALWVWVSKRIRKKAALILGFLITICSVFGIIIVYFFRVELYQISYCLNVVFMFVCGIGSGALYTLPISIYGDAIAQISNNSNNATYLGALTFAGNIANSIAQLIIGILLDVIKFDSSVAVQTLVVQSGLALILFVGVQTFLILGCLTFSSYQEKSEKNMRF